MALSQLVNFYKKPGETPLQALHRLRVERPEFAKEKMTYAGRLDPLAEGELLVLVGEACKDREKYLGLNKTYEVDILFGVSTDTGDVLGKIISTQLAERAYEVESVLSNFLGTYSQQYPLYSSKPVGGEPLFAHARSGRDISDLDRPEKEITVYGIHIQKSFTLTVKEIQKKIEEKINSVNGDFRQEEILKGWHEFFTKIENPSHEFYLASITVDCSSGTYMRVLAEEIGKKLGVPSLAFHIKRSRLF